MTIQRHLLSIDPGFRQFWGRKQEFNSEEWVLFIPIQVINGALFHPVAQSSFCFFCLFLLRLSLRLRLRPDSETFSNLNIMDIELLTELNYCKFSDES